MKPSGPVTITALVGGLLVAVGASQAIPGREELADLDGSERVDMLLSLGLDGECERLLREELDRGEDWARAPLLRLLLRHDRFSEAGRLVDEWGVSGVGGPAPYFVVARIREGEGQWEAAAAGWTASVAREPLLADYAAYRAGLAHAELRQHDEALSFCESAGASARNRNLSASAFWTAAGLAAELGKTSRAFENVERIPARSVVAREDLLGLEAEIHRALGNEEREARVLRELLDRAPSSEQAVDAIRRLVELETPTVEDHLAFAEAALRNRHPTLAEEQARAALSGLGEDADPIFEGKARLHLGKSYLARRSYTAARKELAKMPEGADEEDRAEAALDRARCLWRLGQIDACLAEYDRIADGDFPEEFRATATWEAAREAKDNRRWEESALRLAEFQTANPEHDYADDALWHRGRALAEVNQTEEAVATFRGLHHRYPDSPFVEEAAYWTANLLRDAGDEDAACREFAGLLREHPDSYWSVRAQSALAGGTCVAESVDDDARDQDPFEWLADVLPDVDRGESRRQRQLIRESESFRRATVLAAVGLVSEAEDELASLRYGVRRDPAALLAFAEASWGIGVPRASMRAISTLKAKTGKPILSGETPARVARLLYPIEHLDAVLKWSAIYELDPLFVYAVMREESWFDARAVSWAGAHGLLQIMPATGRDLARRVGLPRFDRSDLFVPEVNIRLGAYYLHVLLKELDREPAMALSAYNAGKKNAIRWKNGMNGDFDVDEYVAGITYRETFNYVQKVTRSWEIYRHLYGDLVPRLQEIHQDASRD
jgi:soluble lytic murein transglycosylase